MADKRPAAPRVFFGSASIGAGRGGLARLSRLTVRALVSMGADLEVLSLLDRADGGLPVTRAASSGGRKLDYALRCHAAALTRSHFLYDTVAVAQAHPGLPMLRRPYGLWMAGIEVWDGLTPSRRRALEQADLTLSISKFTLDRFEEIHGVRPDAPVCWLGTEDDAESPLQLQFSGPPTVIVVGRLEREARHGKGQEELVRVWPAVVAAVPDARLLIVGGGSGLPRMAAAAANSPVAAKIRVVGFVPDDQMDDLWRGAHVFAMPSRGEGFGLVYVEAMRHGLPVIASVHDAGQELNIDGETGFNVSLDGDDALTKRLIELLSDPDLCRKMGEAGRERWRRHFRFSAFRDRLAPVLERFFEL